MNKWEAKKAYAEKRNAENAKIETLTEEQHDTLAELCGIRHKIHTSGDSMFDAQSGDFDFWDYVYDSCDECKINKMLNEVDLPKINFSFAEDCPNSEWYYDLTSGEKEEWEQKADEVNENDNDGTLMHTGYSLWIEKSWEYEEFCETKERINTVIEEYLAEIDKKHGTNYCPTGFTRLY